MLLFKGLGAADQLDTAIDGFLMQNPTPTTAAISTFLDVFPDSRTDAAQRLIARGVNSATVDAALNPASTWTSSKTWGVLSVLSGAACAFHGYRRNQSIGWAIGWGLFGTIFPVIGPVIGAAQGFGRAKV